LTACSPAMVDNSGCSSGVRHQRRSMVSAGPCENQRGVRRYRGGPAHPRARGALLVVAGAAHESGHRISRARTVLGKSQDQFGRDSSPHWSYVGQVERGQPLSSPAQRPQARRGTRGRRPWAESSTLFTPRAGPPPQGIPGAPVASPERITDNRAGGSAAVCCTAEMAVHAAARNSATSRSPRENRVCGACSRWARGHVRGDGADSRDFTQ
jgi:hypothetical protein